MLSYKAITVSRTTDGMYNTSTGFYYQSPDGKPMDDVVTADYGSDGTVDYEQYISRGYYPTGLQYTESMWEYSGSGGTANQTFKQWFWNEDGTLRQEIVHSPDWNGDLYSDYSTIVDHTYDDAGRLILSEWSFLNDGVDNYIDYRAEWRTYTPEGQLDIWQIDDSSLYDDPIAFNYDYNATGQLSAVYYQDPILHGDWEWHQTEALTYDAMGRLTTHTKFNTNSEHGSFAVLTEKLTYPGSTHTKTMVEGDIEGDGVIDFRMLDEEWRKPGTDLVTDILTSYDGNLDGKFTPGAKSGYMDSRDRQKMAYDADGDVTSHTIDYGLDRVMDYTYTAEPLPMDDALIA